MPEVYPSSLQWLLSIDPYPALQWTRERIRISISVYNISFIGLEETMCKKFTWDLQYNHIPRIVGSSHLAATSQ
jgi:hypothetical protein